MAKKATRSYQKVRELFIYCRDRCRSASGQTSAFWLEKARICGDLLRAFDANAPRIVHNTNYPSYLDAYNH